jgi:methionyl aminopeptidase
MITLKSERELELMRKAGQAVGRILKEMATLAKPGISTGEIDKYAEARCKELGVKPAFKGYHGFPACVCISVNEEVVHGIPSKKRILKNGDIVGLDFGVIYDGWYGDSARTVGVGAVPAETQKLLDATEQSLFKGIEQCHVGNKVSDIGYAVQNHVEPLGYSVVREFVGHGIGRALHEDPQVPNYGAKGRGLPLQAGMVIAIEPMVNMGGPEVKVLSDGWTAVTKDKSLSAHFEHTIAITEKGPEILTLVD